MTKWYQNQFRRTLLDMHIEDWDNRFMEQFDPEKTEGDYGAGYNYPLTKSFNVGLNVTF